jgi:hypothetical protein
MKNIIILFSAILLFSLTSCGDATDVVDSGTYEGTIKKIEADKSEIYVDLSNGKTIELYFIDETELTQNGEVVTFSSLLVGQKVEVEVQKVGKRLDPLKVKILE